MPLAPRSIWAMLRVASGTINGWRRYGYETNEALGPKTQPNNIGPVSCKGAGLFLFHHANPPPDPGPRCGGVYSGA